MTSQAELNREQKKKQWFDRVNTQRWENQWKGKGKGKGRGKGQW
jgi:hypothetical protein